MPDGVIADISLTVTTRNCRRDGGPFGPAFGDDRGLRRRTPVKIADNGTGRTLAHSFLRRYRGRLGTTVAEHPSDASFVTVAAQNDNDISNITFPLRSSVQFHSTDANFEWSSGLCAQVPTAFITQVAVHRRRADSLFCCRGDRGLAAGTWRHDEGRRDRGRFHVKRQRRAGRERRSGVLIRAGIRGRSV